MGKYKITHIQIFDYANKAYDDDKVHYSYSAHLIINDAFVVQIWGNEKECGFDGVADYVDASWTEIERQKKAYEEIDKDELLEVLEQQGFENNIGWLEDQASVETMNPENKIYRR